MCLVDNSSQLNLDELDAKLNARCEVLERDKRSVPSLVIESRERAKV